MASEPARQTTPTVSTLKRSNSSASNSAEPPLFKRCVENGHNATSLPEHVYVILHELRPGYTSATSTHIEGVFCDLKDANKCLRDVVENEYSAAESYRDRTKSDGRKFWSSNNVGEGDGATLSIKKQALQPSGSSAFVTLGGSLDVAQDERPKLDVQRLSGGVVVIDEIPDENVHQYDYLDPDQV